MAFLGETGLAELWSLIKAEDAKGLADLWSQTKAEVAKGARVATGSYVGTGTSKDPGQVTLTFDFAPKMLILYQGSRVCTGSMGYGSSSYQGKMAAIGFPQGLTTSFAEGLFYNHQYGNPMAKRSEDGKTITWYHPGYFVDEETEEIYYQPNLGFNYGGSTYNYLAIG